MWTKVFEHVQTLMQQGNYLEITILKGSEATWQSFIFNLPRGTMKLILNSSINALPTKTILKQWGKLVKDNLILSCCAPSLEQVQVHLST